MRQAELMVFDDIIYNGSTAYTAATFNDVLASHDMLAVMAVIDNVSGTSVAFDLFVEHSCDGRNWQQRNDTLNQAFPPTESPGSGDITFSGTRLPLLNANTTYARMFSDSAWNISKIGTSPSGQGPLLGYVRFAMILSAGFAHVKVYAVLRDTTARDARGTRS